MKRTVSILKKATLTLCTRVCVYTPLGDNGWQLHRKVLSGAEEDNLPSTLALNYFTSWIKQGENVEVMN